MLSRIGLFLLTNIAILVVVSIVFSLLGLEPSQTGGFSLGQLLFMCAIMGFVGSFISLAMSKWVALRSTNAHVIDHPQNPQEHFLKNTVAELAQKAGIGMPTVAIFPSHEPNAFATGMKRNDALVAVSTGLLHHMNQEEIKAVLAHEVAHIQNGDMITLTLLQGVVNTFVMFLARIAGGFVDRVLLGNREGGSGLGYFASVIAFQIVFGILASTIVMWFSRKREFRADHGAALLHNPQAMISALRKLERGTAELPEAIQAFGIGPSKHSKLGQLFMSHPPIALRIEALEKFNKLVV